MSQPVACTIAGSDSSGGAGIQADLRTFAACGVYGASVIVAITAQDSVGIRAIETTSPVMVGAQIDAVAGDLVPAAWKTGMLGGPRTVEIVAERLAEHGATRIVVDPVIIATSGARLLEPGAVDLLRRLVVPMATVVTPNLPETRALLGMERDDPLDVRVAARALAALGPAVAVVKGGHADGGEVVDVVAVRDSDEVIELRHPRIDTTSTHGTGCTLSAAIAAFLARRVEPVDAVASARAYLQVALERAPGLGHGRGPLGQLDPGIAAPSLRAPRPAAAGP